MEPGAAKPLEGLRILLVDDEDDVLEVLALLLRIAGAHVDDMPTVEAALASYDRQRPDCLIADLNLDHDGCRLLETIRARENTGKSAPPAIALTGHVLAEDRERAFEAGFQAYLTKPVDPPELVRAVLEAVRRAPAS